MLAHDLSQVVTCWPLAGCPLRMWLFWTVGVLGQVYFGQRGTETGFSPKTSSVSPASILILPNESSVIIVCL